MHIGFGKQSSFNCKGNQARSGSGLLRITKAPTPGRAAQLPMVPSTDTKLFSDVSTGGEDAPDGHWLRTWLGTSFLVIAGEMWVEAGDAVKHI